MLVLDMAQNNIKQLLDERGMTRYRLAQETGISEQTIYPLVAADEIPGHTKFKTLKAIAKVLGARRDGDEVRGRKAD